MSGVTDLPFRRIVAEAGAGGVVSEMVASEEFVRERADVVLRAAFDGVQAVPRILQLAGREERWMEEGASLAEAAGADIVDINMGCPARQVTGHLSGSALMRDLDHAQRLIEATVRGTTKPVTLKMRLGWDHDSLNAPELARRAEAAGVALITVHGRTRQQFYTGQADWTAVAATKKATHLPVIVNGDILDAETARRALKRSGADGVMVGRAAEGRPWLPGAIAEALQTGGHVEAPTAREQAAMMIRLHRETVDHYAMNHRRGWAQGERLGLRTVRKHLAAFIDTVDGPFSAERRSSLRAALCQSMDRVFIEEALFAIGEGQSLQPVETVA